MANKKVKYKEPEGYIPKALRKEFGLGEYATPKKEEPKKNTKSKKK